MRERQTVCPVRGDDAARQDGRDRQGARAYRCRDCRRCFTARSATPFSGYRFPPDVIALAVRWYLRYRLNYADVAELLAERGVAGDPSTVDAWVREFAPLDEDAARAFRRMVGSRWSVDETYVRVAGAWRYVYRAIDEHGQIVDVYLSVRRAIESTGVAPTEVTTDCAAAYPPTLAAVLPDVAHETGEPAQQRIERDHQHLKGRLGATRGFKTLTGAGVRCRAHAFLRNLRGGHDDLPLPFGSATAPVVPAVTHAWLALTTHLLAR